LRKNLQGLENRKKLKNFKAEWHPVCHRYTRLAFHQQKTHVYVSSLIVTCIHAVVAALSYANELHRLFGTKSPTRLSIINRLIPIINYRNKYERYYGSGKKWVQQL